MSDDDAPASIGGGAGAAGDRSTVDARVAALRARFDDVDARLVALLIERMRLAAEIGALKRGAGRPAVDPAREAAVLARVESLARPPLEPAAARRIVAAVLAESRAIVEIS